MKRLSDYKDEEAIELWADLLEPVANILADKEIATLLQSNTPKIKVASAIIKKHKEEAKEILLRIDDTPINALNFATRIVNIILDFENSKEISGFFGQSEQENKAN